MTQAINNQLSFSSLEGAEQGIETTVEGKQIIVPAEIWENIFFHLDKPGLKSTSGVCKKFYLITRDVQTRQKVSELIYHLQLRSKDREKLVAGLNYGILSDQINSVHGPRAPITHMLPYAQNDAQLDIKTTSSVINSPYHTGIEKQNSLIINLEKVAEMSNEDLKSVFDKINPTSLAIKDSKRQNPKTSQEQIDRLMPYLLEKAKSLTSLDVSFTDYDFSSLITQATDLKELFIAGADETSLAAAENCQNLEVLVACSLPPTSHLNLPAYHFPNLKVLDAFRTDIGYFSNCSNLEAICLAGVAITIPALFHVIQNNTHLKNLAVIELIPPVNASLRENFLGFKNLISQSHIEILKCEEVFNDQEIRSLFVDCQSLTEVHVLDRNNRLLIRYVKEEDGVKRHMREDNT